MQETYIPIVPQHPLETYLAPLQTKATKPTQCPPKLPELCARQDGGRRRRMPKGMPALSYAPPCTVGRQDYGSHCCKKWDEKSVGTKLGGGGGWTVVCHDWWKTTIEWQERTAAVEELQQFFGQSQGSENQPPISTLLSVLTSS